VAQSVLNMHLIFIMTQSHICIYETSPEDGVIEKAIEVTLYLEIFSNA
jgi:hypothetical protein